VLIIDITSFHRTKKIKQMCYKTSVKLVYLPPYSLDLKPIKEFFAKLKAIIEKN
jgi:transposase